MAALENLPLNSRPRCYTSLVLIDAPQNLGEYLRTVRDIRKHWGLPEHKELWFRGEDGEYGSTRLRPKLYRPPGRQALKSVADLLDIEDHLFEDFRRCAGQLCDVKPEDDWDWYSLMQHHGVPTRILDWTDGALIGLHFAIRRPGDSNGRAVVFVLDPYRLLDQLNLLPDYTNARKAWKEYCLRNSTEDPDEWDLAYLPDDEEGRKDTPLPGAPLLSDTYQISRRIAGQRSRFMMFGTDPSWISDLADQSDSPIKAIFIDAAAIRLMTHELRDAGITESVI